MKFYNKLQTFRKVCLVFFVLIKDGKFLTTFLTARSFLLLRGLKFQVLARTEEF
jgi:hypothetical protein